MSLARSINFIVMVACLCSLGCIPTAADHSKKTEKEIQVEIREIVANAFSEDPREIDPKRPLTDSPIKADDLGLVELILDLEDHYGIHLDESVVLDKDEKARKDVTVEYLARIVKRKVAR